MRFFTRLGHVDVAPLVAQLDAQPELWDDNQFRTKSAVFDGTGDIWCRYRALDELTAPQRYLEPHFGVFYPAWYKLPALRPLVYDLMRQVEASYLGAILVTRIPPHGAILPHNDRGSWHAEYCRTKLYVGLKSNPLCVNYCGDEAITIGVGDVVCFNNLVTHSVVNDGETERTTLIICMHTETPIPPVDG